MRPVLFIIRAFACGTWFFLSALIALVVAFFRPMNPKNGDFFRALAYPFGLRILGVKLDCRNIERLWSSQPCVFLFNHQSLLDMYVFGTMMPKGMLIIGKKSLRWVPIFGWLFYLSGEILLDRSNRGQAIAQLGLAETRIREGFSVFIAPEGTRSRGKGLGPFKKGAFHLAAVTGVPLQPVVTGSFHRCVDLGRWRAGVIPVEALQPIPTKGLDRDAVPVLLERAREDMLAAIERLDSLPPCIP